MTEEDAPAPKLQVNREIADRFVEAAGLLESQDANYFRVDAYASAANTLLEMDRDVTEIARSGGKQALMEIPTIGDAIAEAILEIVENGTWGFLGRLREDLDPVDVFQTLPGVGPKLARRIHETLNVETLEELEIAVVDGRLDQVDGIGASRAAGIRSALERALRRFRGLLLPSGRKEPDVATLLDVDTEYRGKAASGDLQMISPQRHNPDGEAWLPLLHTERHAWRFTALFSNTARAHMLDRIHDWVVILFEDETGAEGQVTVVTERRGPLDGKRVVRGREMECMDYYGVDEGFAIAEGNN